MENRGRFRGRVPDYVCTLNFILCTGVQHWLENLFSQLSQSGKSSPGRRLGAH